MTGLRERFVEQIRQNAGPLSPELTAAFGSVPREAFVSTGFHRRNGTWATPADPDYLDLVYRDDVLVTKMEGAVPVSSSSQPSLMAIMLAALEVRPGMRVLEIGAGTGYNAALLSALGAHVTSIDVQPDVAARARKSLAAAGVTTATVVLSDGYAGAPSGHFDRVIVTVGVAGLSPNWLAQMAAPAPARPTDAPPAATAGSPPPPSPSAADQAPAPTVPPPAAGSPAPAVPSAGPGSLRASAPSAAGGSPPCASSAGAGSSAASVPSAGPGSLPPFSAAGGSPAPASPAGAGSSATSVPSAEPGSPAPSGPPAAGESPPSPAVEPGDSASSDASSGEVLPAGAVDGGLAIVPVEHAGMHPVLAVRGTPDGPVTATVICPSGFMSAAGPLTADHPGAHPVPAPAASMAEFKQVAEARWAPPLDSLAYRDLWYAAGIWHRRASHASLRPDHSSLALLDEPGTGGAIILPSGAVLAGGEEAERYATDAAKILDRWTAAGRPPMQAWQVTLALTGDPDSPIWVPAEWTLS